MEMPNMSRFLSEVHRKASISRFAYLRDTLRHAQKVGEITFLEDCG